MVSGKCTRQVNSYFEKVAVSHLFYYCRYIFPGSGGDQIVGRALSGLPVSATTFTTLPPHFTRDDLLSLGAIGWSHIFEGYDSYPQCFRRAVPYLLASIVFHHDWLKTNLPGNHPFWQQRLCIGELPSLLNGKKNLILGLYGRVLTGSRLNVLYFS